MKKKELIQLIKTKSEQVEIRDFSKEIIEKAKHLPKPEVIEKTRFSFRLKPYYLATLGVMLTVIMIVLFTPDTPINPIDPTLENMDQVIAFSTLTSVSLIQTIDTDLQTESDDVTLSHGNPPSPRMIENQITDITKYLDMMEKLFGSNPDFDLVVENQTNPMYTNQMRFKTKDLLNEEAEYAINFNQTNIGVHDFVIEGVVVIGEYIYPIYASGSSNDIDTLELEIEQENGNQITIHYEKILEVHDFEIKIYQDDLLIQEVNFTYQEQGEDKQATLDFIYGETVGSYTFQLDVEDQVSLIRITYDIESDESESGEIVIRIRTLLGNTTYVILVMPDGGIPFIINSERQIRPMHGNHQMIYENLTI
jgi:hypothetical protein